MVVTVTPSSGPAAVASDEKDKAKSAELHLECKVVDASLLEKYSFFIMEVVKARAAISPKVPRTIHYRGDGQFMVSGREVSFRKLFRPGML